MPCSKNLKIRINEFIIPFSFFNINANNNKFIISISSVDTTITIPIGNYNIITLCAELNTLLTSYSITVTYSQLTNKITFTKTTSFDILFASYKNNADLLGFSPVNVSGTAITSDLSYKLLPRYITFHSEAIQNYNSGVISSGLSDYVDTIPINTSSGGQINFHNQYQNIFLMDENKTLINDNMYFCDDNGNIINFNGVHPVIKFEFKLYGENFI